MSPDPTGLPPRPLADARAGSLRRHDKRCRRGDRPSTPPTSGGGGSVRAVSPGGWVISTHDRPGAGPLARQQPRPDRSAIAPDIWLGWLCSSSNLDGSHRRVALTAIGGSTRSAIRPARPHHRHGDRRRRPTRPALQRHQRHHRAVPAGDRHGTGPARRRHLRGPAHTAGSTHGVEDPQVVDTQSPNLYYLTMDLVHAAQ